MPDFDVRTMEYWALVQFDHRCHIWRPPSLRIVTASEPQADLYGEPWLTNVPYGKRPARTGNDPNIVGSIEKDLIVTYDLAFFPVNVHMDVDYWYQDVTLTYDRQADGSVIVIPSEKYGAFYSVRGETSDWVNTAINKCGANRIPAVQEDNPPPGATGYIEVAGKEYQVAAPLP